jgi:KaiC/GvpD/RAD55 family RecA-like ATPase
LTSTGPNLGIPRALGEGRPGGVRWPLRAVGAPPLTGFRAWLALEFVSTDRTRPAPELSVIPTHRIPDRPPKDIQVVRCSLQRPHAGSTVSVLLRLPPELVEFSLREPPRSLLIRGEPGAGKSTLALTILGAFRGKRIFLSCRVSQAEVEKDFPWLRSNVDGPVEVIESLVGESRIDVKGRVLAASRAVVEPELGSPELDQLWLPDPLIDAFSRIGPNTPGMVVVDSWDALVEHYIGARKQQGAAFPDREELERLMLDLLGRGRAHLVLVVERPGPTQLDYLVDGVVACVATSNEDRLERWTQLKKMRGVRVNHAWYPYTLEGGRFLCIAPMSPDFRAILQPPEPEPDPHTGFLWPGSSDFATQFGRLPYGRMSVIEVDPEVPVEAVRLLVQPIESQVLSGGGRVLVVQSPSLAPSDVWEAFRPVVSAEAFARQVRIYSPSGLSAVDPNFQILEKVMVPGPASDVPPMTSRMPDAYRFLREGLGAGLPSLGVIWVHGLTSESTEGHPGYSPDSLPGLARRTLANSMTHLIMIGAPPDPLIQSLQGIASIRVALKTRSGRVFVYGVHPRTPPLVLAQSDNGDPYHLIRIV